MSLSPEVSELPQSKLLFTENPAKNPKMNFFLFLSLFVSAVVAIPFYPETSATSFHTNMTQPIRINDDALVRNTAVSSRQQIPSFIYGLMVIKYFKTMISLSCIVMPALIPTCIQLFLNGLQVIFVIITCVVSPTNCPCSNFPTSCSISSNSDTLTNFHMTETHVQNIRSAIEMVMSNPSARNVDALFNLIIDSAAITNSTSSIQDGQDVRQKHFTFPVVPKVNKPFVPAAKSQMTTSTQDNIEFKADADGLQNSYPLSFPVIHPIVPYSHFQWPMYPELLRRHPVLV